MSSYQCPVCKTENSVDSTFSFEEFVCKSCCNIISTKNKTSRGTIQKPTTNVVLNVGQKGTVEGIEYEVVAIVVKKYGASTFWREYCLKDNLGNNAFLSEFDGHWVILFPQSEPLKESKCFAEFKGKKYRWYETTPCHTYSATGFFEDKLNSKLSNYKEFVNGTEMISCEETGKSKEYFWGRHMSKDEFKKSFHPESMPSRFGIGIVQPFYFNVQQAVNILGITALLIAAVQVFTLSSRMNIQVLNETMRFSNLANKEYVSKSFELSGGSAPMEVTASSDVDNSWANVELSLVNETTNEIAYTSQDIEYYHGVEDGESWTEGDKTKNFNFCGVAPGKYHFLISAEKSADGTSASNLSTYITPDKAVSVNKDDLGWYNIKLLKTNDLVSYKDKTALKNDPSKIADTFRKYFLYKDLDSLIALSPSTNPMDDKNSTISIRAKWLPVSMWNFGIVMAVLVACIVGSYAWRYYFQKAKWSNSSNSPYPEIE